MLDKNKSLKHECGCGCADCTCGKRNRFFRGKRMKADDFAIEQQYSIERRRILNRSVIGVGVVNGFEMKKDADVGPGLAIDEHGREIVLAHTATLGLNNVFLLSPGVHGCRPLPLDRATPKKHYLLSIHYAERRFGDVNLATCGCEKPEKNYVCETGVFSLTEVDESPCGEDDCLDPCDCGVTDGCGKPRPPEKPPYKPAPPYRQGETGATADTTLHSGQRPAGETSDERALAEAYQRLRDGGELPTPEQYERPPHPPVDSYTNRNRGPHACLCHRLMKDVVDCTPPRLCEWNGVYIDPKHGVPLACVRITKTGDECDPLDIEVLDACGPRRFVKTNDLLYDLVRGCDLTHISWVSWHAWHRRRELMPWKLFANLFRPSDGWTAFAVRFSAPVLIDTIRYDSVVMRAVTIEQSTDWRLMRRIPIVRFDYTPTRAVPAGTTDQFRIYVSTDWIDDEITGKSTWLTWDGFAIEIDIYGDGILNCHHQPIDGDAIGVEAMPSGNGTPGGTYRSSFRVQAKPHKSENAA